MLIRKTLWTKSVEKQLRAVGRSWCWRNCFTDTQAFRTNKQTLPTSLAWGNVLHLFCQYSLHRTFLVNFIFICKWRRSTAYALWKHLSSHLASDARSSALLRQKLKQCISSNSFPMMQRLTAHLAVVFSYHMSQEFNPSSSLVSNRTWLFFISGEEGPLRHESMWRWSLKQRNDTVLNFCLTETEHSTYERKT